MPYFNKKIRTTEDMITTNTKWKILFNAINGIVKNMKQNYDEKEGDVSEQDLDNILNYIEDTANTIRHFGEKRQ